METAVEPGNVSEANDGVLAEDGGVINEEPYVAPWNVGWEIEESIPESDGNSGAANNDETAQSNLATIISLMFKNNLITEGEKKSIEDNIDFRDKKAEIYDLMAMKDAPIANDILQLVRVFGGAETIKAELTGKKESATTRRPNPLYIEKVLETLFGLLRLNDIKNCRLVCVKWNEVAEPILRTISKVVFARSSESEFVNRTVYDFNEAFGDMQTFNIPFTSFSFRCFEDAWSISELTDFFQERKDDIFELDFYTMRLVDDEYAKVKIFDIREWINDAHITRLTIKDSEAYGSPKLSVPLHCLHFVDDLKLSSCNICVREGKRMSPRKLKLENVMFYQEDGKKATRLRLNDYIDFDKTEVIFISVNCFDVYENTNCTVTLDLVECVYVNLLFLKGVTPLNWRTSKSRINNMELFKIPFVEKTKMKIYDAEFTSTSVDLFALSPKTERLKFTRAQISCSKPVGFPKLKSVTFVETASIHNIFNFANCGKLVDVDISKCKNPDWEPNMVEINLNWIPKSVKRMKLTGKERITGGVLRLKVLILADCIFTDAATVLQKIKPKSLVMRLNHVLSEIEDLTVSFVREQLGSVKKFYIGPYLWSRDAFAISFLFEFVDIYSKYYVFEDQRGVSIEEAEFNSMDFTNEIKAASWRLEKDRDEDREEKPMRRRSSTDFYSANYHMNG